MRSAFVRRAALVASIAGSSVVLGSACDQFEFPSGTCRGARISAANLEGEEACVSCLERPKTCDAVGRCEDTPGCPDAVREAHACVLDAGPRGADRERACTAGLGEERAFEAYVAMREDCGRECGLPVCRVDPATIQLGAPSCDKCITGACCDAVTSCYANRTCKLTMECVLSCEEPFDPAPFVAACADRALDASSVAPDGCVARCLVAFRDHEPFAASADKSAACLASSLMSCARAAGCLDACAPVDASPGP